CFYEVLYLTIDLVDEFNQGQSREYEEVRLMLERVISEQSGIYIDGGYSDEQYQMALYAVVAFIDESIMLSAWKHKKEWKKELLQAKYFKSVHAGEEFYTQLNKLSPFDPAEKDIREVYYYCLTLGYRGKYYTDEDQSYLDKLKAENLTLLKGVEERSSGYDRDKHLFPEAYITGQEGSGIDLHIDYRPFAYGIPVIIFIIVFYMLKVKIFDAASYLITTI
ncbi:MAG: DotU family type IV/VI secretion system protein, partial [SAR324 cluster bacterium]|nr:DotU family type IV/VI secretion system protein [SAR324 cluster bacterium]